MLSVTDEALAHLATLLEEADAPDGVVARLIAKDNSIELGMDTAQPEDRTFDHGGRTVLVLDEETSSALDERTMDVSASDEGTVLTIS